MPTIHELLSEAIPRLQAAGVDTPRLDAEVLLAHVLGRERAWVWAHPEVVLSAADEERFRALLERRLQREPLAYLLGEREFYGRPFFVTPAVLVPRPETELLVEAVVQWARERGAATLADVGAGSGAIAVTLALELPRAQIVAVDLSSAALEITRRNAERHGVLDRLTLLEGDLLAPVRQAGVAPLDAVVANLPYIAEEDYLTLMPEVREHEPALALRAEEGGLALIRRLIAQAPPLLARDGLLALEVGAGQADAVVDLLISSGWRQLRVIEDYGGIPRHVLGVI
ncbi:MAG: peptide chain release factor N(5)-glutamine methyltransferase [Armatimonadota bacterium]